MNMYGGGSSHAHAALNITVECMDERGIRHEIDTVLGYRRNDPFAVSMTFVTGEGNVVWTLSRDLLMRGVHCPAGDGDVRVSPAISRTGRAMVNIELTSPDGHLAVLARSTDINDFLRCAAVVVSPGSESEHFDVDMLISQVLAS